ncbi:GNAT family N-acetyltransferase [Christensenellaceae bacterium OttesenSCG-928-K19]|nr:GNAT family N-acetyltransferase [Christensenellaceae bacterium OttesenSCG-928-K19]
MLDKPDVFVIVLKETSKVIGSIGLIKDPKREYDECRMLGYAIGKHYWGRGIMTEAVQAVLKHGFDTLQLMLISAYCYPFNTASRRVLEKNRFFYEGVLRTAERLYTGDVMDNLCFSIRRREYSSK